MSCHVLCAGVHLWKRHIKHVFSQDLQSGRGRQIINNQACPFLKGKISNSYKLCVIEVRGMAILGYQGRRLKAGDFEAEIWKAGQANIRGRSSLGIGTSCSKEPKAEGAWVFIWIKERKASQVVPMGTGECESVCKCVFKGPSQGRQRTFGTCSLREQAGVASVNQNILFLFIYYRTFQLQVERCHLQLG